MKILKRLLGFVCLLGLLVIFIPTMILCGTDKWEKWGDTIVEWIK